MIENNNENTTIEFIIVLPKSPRYYKYSINEGDFRTMKKERLEKFIKNTFPQFSFPITESFKILEGFYVSKEEFQPLEVDLSDSQKYHSNKKRSIESDSKHLLKQINKDKEKSSNFDFFNDYARGVYEKE